MRKVALASFSQNTIELKKDAMSNKEKLNGDTPISHNQVVKILLRTFL